MNIKQVAKGLEQNKKYQLPDWERFYIYKDGNAIMIRTPNTEPMIYNLHISELLSNEWKEVI